MHFPVFGDAESNIALGKACAALIENGATPFSCLDRDPLAKIVYFSLPYLVSKDPVVIDHLTLGLKFLVFLLFVFTAIRVFRLLAAADHSLTLTDAQLRFGVTVISVLLLAVCLNNIPLRLADMEAACCAMIAVSFALSALLDTTERKIVPYTNLFLACLFADLSGLFKLSFFVREFLLILAFSLCLERATSIRLLKDWRIYIVIVAANVGFGIQLSYVWWHFGSLGVTQPGVLDVVATARQYPYVAMELYSLPTVSAYMLSVQNDVSWFGWYVYKVYYALVISDPFVYGGFAKPGGYLIPSSINHWVPVYSTVVAFFALVTASIKYGSTAIRFVTLLALFNILFMTVYQHVEPRYHILPKAILILLGVYWTCRAWQALRLFARRPDFTLFPQAPSYGELWGATQSANINFEPATAEPTAVPRKVA